MQKTLHLKPSQLSSPSPAHYTTMKLGTNSGYTRQKFSVGQGRGWTCVTYKKPPKCKFLLRLLSMTVPHKGREGYLLVGQLASQRTGSDIPSSLCSIYTLPTQIYNKAPPHPRSPLIYFALTYYTSSSLVALFLDDYTVHCLIYFPYFYLKCILLIA